MKLQRYTQQSKLKLLLEKLVKSNVIFYKIAFIIKEKLLGSLFYEEDLKGLDFLSINRNNACIDVGANVGQSIEYFKSRFKKVYAFEPNPKNFIFLKKKYKNKKNISIFNFALGDKKENKFLYVPYWKNLISLHQSASFFKEECYKTLKEFLNINKSSIKLKKTRVRVERMDKFKFKDISFIKIDAEGYEKQILLGMRSYLKKKDIILLIENSSRSFQFCKNFLKKYDFEPFAFKDDKMIKKKLNDSLNIYFLKKKKRTLN